MTQEALKLALEALEEAWYHVGTFQPTEKAIDLYDEARTAIKEALAQTQEPVAWYHAEDYKTHFTTNPSPDLIGKYWKPLYTHPPQRTWVGLTDEEVSEVFGGDIHAEHSGELRFVRAIEAKLKEKNT
jgi:hypothetical protein